MIKLNPVASHWICQHFGDRPWSVSGARMVDPQDFEEMPKDVIYAILEAARMELQRDEGRYPQRGYAIIFDDDPTIKANVLARLLEQILQKEMYIYLNRDDQQAPNGATAVFLSA